jgi:perosamine synthetase
MGWRIPVARPDLGAAEQEAVSAVVARGWITQGPEVRAFEAEFAGFCGARHAVATSSGTAALHVALLALEVEAGDEVITTPLSCIASANPILFQGARPVFVDVEPRTYNLDVTQLEKRLTARTRAILPVHLFGHPVDLDPLLAVAAAHGVPVIEDCSQAAGAEYRGRRVGALGRCGIFSLYANKIVTAAEGGMVVTDDAELADRMRAIRNFGQRPGEHFVHAYLGGNYKTTDLHAALGRVQLRKAEAYIARRRRHRDALTRRLAGLTGLIEALPLEEPYARAVPFAYPILFRTAALRERAEAALHAASIETRPFFSLINDQAPYRARGYDPADTPVAAELFPRGLYVSASPDLTDADLAFVASVLAEVARPA